MAPAIEPVSLVPEKVRVRLLCVTACALAVGHNSIPMLPSIDPATPVRVSIWKRYMELTLHTLHQFRSRFLPLLRPENFCLVELWLIYLWKGCIRLG